VRLAPRDLAADARALAPSLSALALVPTGALTLTNDAASDDASSSALVPAPPPLALVPAPVTNPFESRAALARYVAVESEAKLRVAAGAGMRKVILAMTEHLWVASVQEAGLIALRNLALKVDGRLPEVAAEGVRAAVAALNAHSAVQGVQEAALAALRALTRLADPADVFEEGIEGALRTAHFRALNERQIKRQIERKMSVN
jgi:hypothetical protein